MRCALLRRRLLVSSSVGLLLSISVGSLQAAAQSFQGTASVVAGAASVSTSANSTTIVLSAPSSVIDWTPTDRSSGPSPVNFQLAGTTATFTNDPQLTNGFAVLNRILPADPSRAVALNGTTLARLQSASGTIGRGGTIFFYSPGGILVGGTAVIDVGRLGLTSAPLEVDSAGTFLTDTGLARFTTANPGTQVSIAKGARLTASDFVAVVAPVVTNNGVINGGKSTALVAADAARITFSPSGLFDIEVEAGSSGLGDVLGVGGTITGSASPSPGEAHRVYLVAVPRNAAITMAISSGTTLGFDIAGAANLDGNAVVLSAGQDIVSGNVAAARSPGGGSGAVDVAIGAMTATSSLSVGATGGVTLGAANMTSRFHGNLAVESQASITTLGTLASSGHGAATTISLAAAGDVTVEAVNAAVDFSASASRFSSTGPVVAAGDIDLLTVSSVQAAALTAGDDVTVRSGSDVTIDLVRTTGVGPDDALFDRSGQPDRANVAIDSAGAVTLGSVSAKATLAVRGASVAGTDWAAGEDLAIVSSADVRIGALVAADDINIVAVAGGIDLDSVATTGLGPDDRRVQFSQTLAIADRPSDRANVALEAAGPLAVGSANARASLVMRAAQITGGDWTAGEDIALRSTGPVSIMHLVAADDISVTSTGDVRIGALETTGGGPDDRQVVEAGVAPTFLAGANNRANATIDAQGAVSMQTATVRASLAARGARVEGGAWQAGEDIAVSSTGSAALGTLQAGDDVTVAAAGPLTVNDVLASGTGDDNRTAVFAAAGPILFQDSGADQSNIALAATGSGSGGDLIAGALDAAGRVQLEAGANLSGATVSSGSGIAARAGGNVVLGDMRTAAGALDVRAGGAITAGNGSAPGDAFLLAGRSVLTGALSGRNVVVLAGGDVQTAALTALASPGSTDAGVASGQIVVAGTGSATALDIARFQVPSLPLVGEPARLPGSILITGPVAGSGVTLAALGSLTAGAIDAGSLVSVTAVRVAIGQRWSSPAISISATDLDIATSGTGPMLDAGANGTVALHSTNADGVLLGDGLTGAGFSLGSAELRTIAAARLVVDGITTAGTGPDMLIGGLDLARPQFASGQLAAWNLELGVHDGSGLASGRIRVVGNVRITGVSHADRLTLRARTFQLDTTAGGLVMEAGSGEPGGEIAIVANDIALADANLLAQIATQPFGAQLAAELDAPAAIQRPDGVLAARRLTLMPGATLFVQNTGTAGRPAGILAGAGLIDLAIPTGLSRSAVAVVINGQYAGNSGLPAQNLAYDLFVASLAKGLVLAPESVFNGCLILAGQCGMVSQVSAVQTGQLVALLAPRLDASPQFAVIEAGTGDAGELDGGAPGFNPARTPSETVEEQAEARREARASAASPIPAPPVLIDVRPLGRLDDSPALGLGTGTPGINDNPGVGGTAE